MNNKVLNKLSKVANTSTMKIKKYSPEILLTTGIVGMVGTVALACKATLHAEDVVDEHMGKMYKIGEAIRISEADPESFEYPEEYRKKDKLVTYVQTGVSFTKLYAPAITLGAVSIGCILAGNKIMKKRYLGVVAAYGAVSEAFSDYRKRVVEEAGIDMDRHYRFGTELNEVTSTETDENGKKKKVKETVENADPNKLKPADNARFFDSSNPNWDKCPSYNMMFLKAQETMFNDLLHTRGHVFLNEVYDGLGFPMTSEGAVTGWVEGLGDNYIDFGLYNPDNDNSRRFVNGDSDVILLDFNTDGVIWDKI